MIWTDIWCFICNHEIRRAAGDAAYQHIDPEDALDCACTDVGETCQPL